MTEQEREILIIRAQVAAIIAKLQVTPTSDGKPILGPERWKAFQDEFRDQAEELGVKLPWPSA